MTNALLRFINIVLVALLAGVSFGIWMVPKVLLKAVYLEQQQNLVRSLQALMISLVIAATLVTITSALLSRKDKTTFVSLIIAALFLASCMVITRLGNVPIDDMVLSWTMDTMPSDWMSYQDKWRSFHTMRTIVELLALFIVTWSAVRPKTHQA